MTAAMNGSVNLSVADGWVPEFAKHGINSYVIPANDSPEYFAKQDEEDLNQLYNILETALIPTFYQHPDRWISLIKNSINDVTPSFDSHRMVNEYYDKMY